LTIGFRGEGSTANRANFGPTVSFLEKNIGIFSASISQSVGDYVGTAGFFSHTYQSKWFSSQVYVQGNSRDYRTIAPGDLNDTDILRLQYGVSVGYSTKDLGSISFNYGETKKYVGLDMETYGATYQRLITDRVQLSLTYTHTNQNLYGDVFGIRFTWYPGKDTTVSLAHQRDNKTDLTTFQVQKNAPVGEGYGYRLTASQGNAPEISSTYVNPFVQINGKYGIYTAEYRGQYSSGGNNEAYQVSAAGGIVFVGGTAGLTRPVYDSFGLVRVADLKGIEVSQNNQVIGKTNSSGKIFVPSMNSFSDNYISINDKNLPLNYTAHYINRQVSPPYRSGSVIPFDITKIQGITGTLHVKTQDKMSPVEFAEITLTIKGKSQVFPVGKAGELYMENVPPGKYRAELEYMDKKLYFDIIIPRNDETMIDLGKIIVDND
jgi:outer membrane usher protein